MYDDRPSNALPPPPAVLAMIYQAMGRVNSTFFRGHPSHSIRLTRVSVFRGQVRAFHYMPVAMKRSAAAQLCYDFDFNMLPTAEWKEDEGARRWLPPT